MVTQVVPGDLTVPAGTPIATPASLVVPVQSGWISRATLTIPRGPNGLAGWALQLAGSPLIPYMPASWIIADDYTYAWEIDRWVNQGQLVALGYNLGVYPHTFRFRVEWAPNEPAVPVTADLASSTPQSDATELAVSGITGYAPDDSTAALATTGGL